MEKTNMEKVYLLMSQIRGILPCLFCALVFVGIVIIAVGRWKSTKICKVGIYILFIIATSILIVLSDEGTSIMTLNGVELHHETGEEKTDGSLYLDENIDGIDMSAISDKYILNKGVYTLRVFYGTDTEDNQVEIYDDYNLFKSFSLPVSENKIQYNITLDKDVNFFSFFISLG